MHKTRCSKNIQGTDKWYTYKCAIKIFEKKNCLAWHKEPDFRFKYFTHLTAFSYLFYLARHLMTKLNKFQSMFISQNMIHICMLSHALIFGPFLSYTPVFSSVSLSICFAVWTSILILILTTFLSHTPAFFSFSPSQYRSSKSLQCWSWMSCFMKVVISIHDSGRSETSQSLVHFKKWTSDTKLIVLVSINW